MSGDGHAFDTRRAAATAAENFFLSGSHEATEDLVEGLVDRAKRVQALANQVSVQFGIPSRDAVTIIQAVDVGRREGKSGPDLVDQAAAIVTFVANQLGLPT